MFVAKGGIIEQFYRTRRECRARPREGKKKKPAKRGLACYMAGTAKRMSGRLGGLIGGPTGVMRGSMAGDGVS
jgi:hypothetical protein